MFDAETVSGEQQMTVLVTGAAGFIGSHVSKALLARGEKVIGADNLSDYYAPSLKRDRLALLTNHPGFTFRNLDIAEPDEALPLATDFPDLSHIVHLAAQPGVRYSLDHPFTYVRANVMGHVVVAELARRLDRLEHMVYASSSSVYGANETETLREDDRVDQPTNLYGATKRADELISHAYGHLFGIPQTGLRLFTVYGPWGRPDMAVYGFTDAILADRPITVFNDGDMWRDFTYVADVVDGIVRALDRPPAQGTALYNLGNNRPVKVMDLIHVLERSLGRKAHVQFAPRPKTDMRRTAADVERSRKDLGYDPRTSIEEGVPLFVDWYRSYHAAQPAMTPR